MTARLERRLGLPGAVAIGLAAMLGTGVFAAWTPALALAGSALLASLGLAAAIAGLNAWSTAALARLHPEAGGAYAYGRARLSPAAGAVAGWCFVVGKAASAGAAALTIGAYLQPSWQRPLALAAIVLVLGLDLLGVTRTAQASAVSAIAVLAVLAALVLASAPMAGQAVPGALSAPEGPLAVLGAAGLLFVAFAGYARVATLGEEVRDPRCTLPWAIGLALLAVLVAYAVVAALPVLGVLGQLPRADWTDAPLETVAATVSGPALGGAIRVAAVLAAGGALLSLIAGTGRTLFAMGRGGHAPASLAAVSFRGVPDRAQVVAACGAGAVAAVGGIGAALGLSAVTILGYYGIAHLAALRIPRGEGAPPRWVPVAGLVGCFALAASLVALAAVAA